MAGRISDGRTKETNNKVKKETKTQTGTGPGKSDPARNSLQNDGIFIASGRNGARLVRKT